MTRPEKLPDLVDRRRWDDEDVVRYSPALAREICDRLANGESLESICKDAHMPSPRAVRKWALNNYKNFSPDYARARELQAECWADQIITLADRVVVGARAEDIAGAKLAIDARKWIAAKLLPRRFGERVEQIVSVGDGAEPQDAMAILLAIANDPAQPASVRLRAAEACVGYERPKLSSSVQRNENVYSIGDELDAARKRLQRGNGPIIDHDSGE